MRTGAKLEVIIEVLENILASNTPADHLLRKNLSKTRYAGSSDRRFIGDMVFKILRNYFRLTEKCKILGRNANPRLLALLCYYEEYGPDFIISTLTDGVHSLSLSKDEINTISQFKKTEGNKEQFSTHNWLIKEIERSLGNESNHVFYSLSKQPNIDLRVNICRITRCKVISELKELGLDVTATPVSPIGIRLSKRLNFLKLNLFKEGFLEVQDEGSQIVSRLLGAEKGMNVADVCAGGGGKALAMWADMEEEGSITVSDVSQKRLEKIKPRMKRAGIKKIKMIESIDTIKGLFDLVLADVPCSGSGAWRRRPEEGIRLDMAKLINYKKIQENILRQASDLIEKDGILAYVTCSFFKSENEDQITSFLKRNNNFELLDSYYYWEKKINNFRPKTSNKYFNLRPHDYETDGFFLARLRRTK